MKNQKERILFGLSVLFVAAFHFVISFYLSFAAGIGADRTTKFIANVLTFPLQFIPANSNIPFFPVWGLLSLIWGWAICYGIKRSGL
jgi:hypothetical protein